MFVVGRFKWFVLSQLSILTLANLNIACSNGAACGKVEVRATSDGMGLGWAQAQGQTRVSQARVCQCTGAFANELIYISPA